tara:strand:- start:57 stop:323 length:267 start_codon:yes stop_codon:yes gene_type:complete
MVKKKQIKKSVKKPSGSKKSKNSLKEKVVKSSAAQLYTSDINKDIKNVKKQIGQAESWMIERRKFVIKLLWVTGLIIILLFISSLYLV